ncbi:MAG: hypothetical protein MMC33_003949 [Icmadophila ericetorum]|nr:hypothetical protein [Icmadophila ericetorum]
MALNITNPTVLEHNVQENSSPQLLINHRPFEVHLLSNARLTQFPLLCQVLSVINQAFTSCHVVGTKEYFPPNQPRIRSPQELVEDLGPDCFTIVVTQSMEELTDSQSLDLNRHLILRRVLGTASCRPFIRPRVVMNVEPAPISPWVPKVALEKLDDPSVSQWELKLMAVDPSLQRQGLASKMIDLVIEEIKRRVGGGKREVWMVFTTMKEFNEAYYSKRGCVSVSETVIEPGTRNSRDGFTILEMAKRIL